MPEACNFIKKETLAQMFSREFCEIFKNTFFTEHLRTTASGVSNLIMSAIYPLTHAGGPAHIETGPLNCKANQ